MNYQSTIDRLCQKYGYKQSEYFDGILVTTPLDKWIIKIAKNNLNREIICLYHVNKYQGSGYHFQGSFDCKMKNVFRYIANHERKPFTKNSKVFRIKELLNVI